MVFKYHLNPLAHSCGRIIILSYLRYEKVLLCFMIATLLVACKSNSSENLHSLSRAEQICGQYLSLVEMHCCTQHKVEWYADQLHLSPKYLSNIVHQTICTSPNACISQAILRKAKSLLSSTSLSVQQISDRLGFQNQSHFGTFFKRRTGMNPSAFKRSVSE